MFEQKSLRKRIKVVRFMQSTLLLMLWVESSHLIGKVFEILFPSKPNLAPLDSYLGFYVVAAILAVIGIAGAISYKIERSSKLVLVFEHLPRPVYDGK